MIRWMGSFSERLDMTTRDQLAELALKLDVDDRAFLADLLAGSLQEDRMSVARLAQEWTDEIDRRIDAYERGEMPSMSIEEGLASVRAALGERRQSPVQ